MTEITQADRDAAEEHFDLWYPNTAWGYEPLVEAFAHHRLAERAKIAAWMRELPDEVVKAAIDRANAMARQTTEGAFRIVAAALADALQETER